MDRIDIRKIVPAVLWAGLIFYFSSVPSLKSPFGIWDLYLRKAAHVGVYFILYILVIFNFTRKNLKARILALVISSVYAVTDEYHQSFVPGRHMSLYDMAFDWIGCLLGYASIYLKKYKITGFD
ncbi:MAG: VanZ family protein [Elusimicrobiota bacterium]